MIEIKTLSLGDKLYKVQEKNNVFSREKIRTVIDGEEWFRYSAPIREYQVIEYEVKGIIRKTLIGEIPMNSFEFDYDEYFVCSETGVDEIFEDFSNEPYLGPEWFSNKEEAIDNMNKLKEKAAELDRI